LLLAPVESDTSSSKFQKSKVLLADLAERLPKHGGIIQERAVVKGLGGLSEPPH